MRCMVVLVVGSKAQVRVFQYDITVLVFFYSLTSGNRPLIRDISCIVASKQGPGSKF